MLFNSEKRDRYFCIEIDEPIFTVNHMTFFIANFRLNLVKKNDVTLPRKYGNFTRTEFYGIFACLVLASEKMANGTNGRLKNA